MSICAVVHARMGSKRLPGKAMLPLAGLPAIRHVLERTRASDRVDDIVLATTEQEADDVLANCADRAGIATYRGSKTDVLGRLYNAAKEHSADVVIRVPADTLLLLPACVDHLAIRLSSGQVEYATSGLDRTLPLGFMCEGMTMESLSRVHRVATSATDREHVTTYYRDNLDEFEYEVVRAAELDGVSAAAGRTDLRFTLDRAADYELLRRVYEGVQFEGILPAKGAVRYVDQHDLARINAHVSQC